MEQRAWHAFKWICSIFLGNFKSSLHQESVAESLGAYKELVSHVFKNEFSSLTP